MSELSHFEAESAKTPKLQPGLIMAGAILMPIAFWALSVFAPTDAVKQMKAGSLKTDVTAEAAPAPTPSMDDEDDE